MIRRELLDVQPIDGNASVAGHVGEHEAKAIAIASLGITGEIPLADEVLEEETTNP
jgi:hypothetical protein